MRKDKYLIVRISGQDLARFRATVGEGNMSRVLRAAIEAVIAQATDAEAD